MLMSTSTSPLKGKPIVKGFFEKRTSSVQYVVADPDTKRAVIIDPVLDFDPKSGDTDTKSADELLAHVKREGYTLDWILDTHPHADHFSAAGYLKDRTGVPTAIGDKVVEVQQLWKEIYNLPDSFRTDGSQWDRLFKDGERFRIGNLDVEVMFTPGHTLASIAYVIGDAAFIHDTIFMPDGGTARADFPGGSAKALWASIQRIMALPDETRLFTGHDYCPGGRQPQWESTVAGQRARNTHLTKAKTEEEFVALREKRDRELPMPKLILHSLQVNIRGGRLPEPEENGKRYLKIPLDALEGVPWGD
jgi:glyoxylase-like metal-dependent hydrolase (beta-lactamase superfamily II)